MKKMFIAWMISLMFCCTMMLNVSAQEADNDMFSFGQVVSIGDQQVTIKEYDFVQDADVEVVYDVTSETEYGNVTSLSDLVVADNVVVDYMEKDGKKVITTLVKEEVSAETPEDASNVMEEGNTQVSEVNANFTEEVVE